MRPATLAVLALWVTAAAWAQLPAPSNETVTPPSAPSPTAPPTPRQTTILEIVAVKAVHTNDEARRIAPDLREVEEALDGVRGFNQFSRIASTRIAVFAGDEAAWNITDALTLRIIATPLENQCQRLRARLCQQSRGPLLTRTRDIVNTTTVLNPGSHLLLGGAPYEDGQLALVITLIR